MSERLNSAKRWGGYLAMVLIFAAACVLLSNWQFARRAEALAEIARVEHNYDAPAVPLATVLPDRTTWAPDDKWKVVRVTGEYLAVDELLVRNRPLDGASGYEVLTPFRTTEGTVVFLDRGWIGQAGDGPSSYPAPPTGHVTVNARLKPAEPAVFGRTASGREFATIDLPEMAKRVDGDVYTSAYGIVVHTDGGVPAPLPRPTEDEGPHLSYAIQWILFALAGFAGLIWAIRRERKLLAEARELGLASETVLRRAVSRTTVGKRRDVDTEAEDAALDD
ncbi:MAG TPA: SURF1 family protein [Candidatus Lumbricidophila sp.]|nr:SURF1 family protein [Candidatus Lumbricidophila sp.]